MGELEELSAYWKEAAMHCQDYCIKPITERSKSYQKGAGQYIFIQRSPSVQLVINIVTMTLNGSSRAS